MRPFPYRLWILLLSLPYILLIDYLRLPYTLLFHILFCLIKIWIFILDALAFPFYDHISLKLDFRSKECLFLGYSQLHKGYICLSSRGRIFISKDVLFDEHKFPYSVFKNHQIQLKMLVNGTSP